MPVIDLDSCEEGKIFRDIIRFYVSHWYYYAFMGFGIAVGFWLWG